MNLRQDFIPYSPKKRPKTKMKPTSITIHSTGNSKSTARNERGWLTNPSNNRSASWHYVVDDKEVIQAIPDNEVAYHSGTRAGNYSSISIEMCESGDRKKVINQTIELVIFLMNKHKITASKVVRHHDWSGKNCPRILNYNNWEGWTRFKTQLNIELKGGVNKMTEKEVVKIVNRELDKREKERDNSKQQAWSDEAIKYVKKEGIMKGYEDGSFKPNKPVTRAELAQVLYNLK